LTLWQASQDFAVQLVAMLARYFIFRGDYKFDAEIKTPALRAFLFQRFTFIWQV